MNLDDVVLGDDLEPLPRWDGSPAPEHVDKAWKRDKAHKAATARYRDRLRREKAVGEILSEPADFFNDDAVAQEAYAAFTRDRLQKNNPSNEVESKNSKDLQALREQLPELEPRFREVLSLRFGLDGDPWSYVQIGKKLGIPPERARKLQEEGLAALRQLMQPAKPSPEEKMERAEALKEIQKQEELKRKTQIENDPARKEEWLQVSRDAVKKRAEERESEKKLLQKKRLERKRIERKRLKWKERQSGSSGS